jgi:hypothetical protein
MKAITVAILLISSTLSVAADVQLSARELAVLAQRAKEVHMRQEPLAKELETLIGADTKVTLYSVDPKIDYSWQSEGKRNGVDVFRDRPIRGYAEIEDKDEMLTLIRDIIAGIRQSDGRVAACFDPHHGLTIVRGAKKVDLLICFTCLNGQAFGAYAGNEFLVTSSPLKKFNESLLKHHLPLPTVP